MLATLTTLISQLDSPKLTGTSVIPWGCPVPSFGDLARSRVATLGLNPSNREFVDKSGKELQGQSRRFHTLNSLGLKYWSDVNSRHLRLILDSFNSYFFGNPYDIWFRKLDQIVSATRASYYDEVCQACHLDLIPYATKRKWSELSQQELSSLLKATGDTLALLLRDSPVEILILNGTSVINRFESTTGVRLERKEMGEWSLPRRAGPGVKGFAYHGVVDTLSGIELGRSIMVLGFNHNIQSSFGVTTKVVNAIRCWVTKKTNEVPV